MFALFWWDADETGGGWNDFKSMHTTIREAEHAMRDVLVLNHNTNQTRQPRLQCCMKAQIVDLMAATIIFDTEESNPWALRLETRVPGEDWKVFAVGPSSLLDKPNRQAAWEWFAANCPTSHFGPQTESRVAPLMDADDLAYLVRTGPFVAVKS